MRQLMLTGIALVLLPFAKKVLAGKVAAKFLRSRS
jgi:hypothetical protein